MAIVLIGAPGAGKTTVGRRVAQRLQREFIDVDALIEQRAGKPVAEIFADDGEQAFRALEETTTLDVLDSDAVVSLGGGAVLNQRIGGALPGRHTVVWLQVSITQASRRVGMNRARPLLLGNVRAQLIDMLAQRTPYYEAAATMTVDTDKRSVDDIVDDIAARLGEQGHG